MKTITASLLLAIISLGSYAQQKEKTNPSIMEENQAYQAELNAQSQSTSVEPQQYPRAQKKGMSDIVPTEGTSEIFTPNEGDYFLDPGGFGGSTTMGTIGNYPNCDCTTHTTLEGVVKIEFIYFSVFSNFDYLIIYDGNDPSDPILYDTSAGGINDGDRSLTDMIASHGSAFFTSTSGSLHFEFYATDMVDYGGWDSYIWNTVDKEPACGDDFMDTGGATDEYGYFEEITFHANPDNPGEASKVTFSSFDVEIDWDALYVYDGPDTSYPLISSGNPPTSSIFPAGGYYGTTPPGPFTATHASGILTFVFMSDGAVTEDGWEASVSCVPLQPANISCADDFFDTGGAGGEYWYEEELTTTVTPDPGKKVTVTFSSFDVESDYDALYVYDGPNDSAPLIDSGLLMGASSSFPDGGYYGNTIPGPFTSTHPSGALTFVFMSDDLFNYGGWEASVTCSPLGIVENSIEGLSFYPNPVKNKLSFSSQQTIEKIVFHDLLGRTVKVFNPNNPQFDLDVSSLSTGTYIMKVVTPKKMGSYKIIKN